LVEVAPVPGIPSEELRPLLLAILCQRHRVVVVANEAAAAKEAESPLSELDLSLLSEQRAVTTDATAISSGEKVAKVNDLVVNSDNKGGQIAEEKAAQAVSEAYLLLQLIVEARLMLRVVIEKGNAGCMGR
jgi:hypothetical protein